jgi:hypothetical protein
LLFPGRFVQKLLGCFWQGQGVMDVDAIFGCANVAIKSTVSEINVCSLAQLCITDKQHVVFIAYLGQ